jgi:hypothetical protein
MATVVVNANPLKSRPRKWAGVVQKFAFDERHARTSPLRPGSLIEIAPLFQRARPALTGLDAHRFGVMDAHQSENDVAEQDPSRSSGFSTHRPKHQRSLR